MARSSGNPTKIMSITTTPHGRGQPTRFDSILGAEEVIEDLILNIAGHATLVATSQNNAG